MSNPLSPTVSSQEFPNTNERVLKKEDSRDCLSKTIAIIFNIFITLCFAAMAIVGILEMTHVISLGGNPIYGIGPALLGGLGVIFYPFGAYVSYKNPDLLPKN